eukprot:8368582-Ditylum_brightwellii.AAC.1
MIEFLLSNKEKEFIEESLLLKAIPQPQILVKDHKKPGDNGEFPTRLVIPATNFIASFSKLGYMDIKKVLDDNGANYSKCTIIQSSNLKEKLEALELKQNKITVMSLDIVNMYPSVRFKLIWKALNHYVRDLPDEAKKTTKQCMDIVQFGMKNTLIQF